MVLSGVGDLDDSKSLESHIAEVLPHLDERLAAEGAPLSGRATQAAVAYAKHFVTEVEVKDREPEKPGSTADILASDWFRQLYRAVEQWYRERYGEALDRTHTGTVAGVVPIFGTPFRLDVPVVVRSPGESNTIWIGFPAEVLNEEDVLAWVQTPPNLAKLDSKERRKLEKLVTEIANELRRTRNTLLSVEAGGEQFEGLKAGIMPRLEQAAELIASGRPETVQPAYWELQVACEHALKLLELQQTGTFTETHDLFVLYDRITQPPPSCTRDTLKGVPRWEEMIDLRYGQGSRTDVGECFAAYRKALRIVTGAVSSLKHHKLHEARFQIQAPPWTRE